MLSIYRGSICSLSNSSDHRLSSMPRWWSGRSWQGNRDARLNPEVNALGASFFWWFCLEPNIHTADSPNERPGGEPQENNANKLGVLVLLVNQVLLRGPNVPLHFGEFVAQFGVIRQHNVVGPKGIVGGCLLHEQVLELVRWFNLAAHSLNYKYHSPVISWACFADAQIEY